MITSDDWVALGLLPEMRAVWALAPASFHIQTTAQRSVTIGEGWLVVMPDWQNCKRDVVLGCGLRPQRARDVAEFLATGCSSAVRDRLLTALVE